MVDVTYSAVTVVRAHVTDVQNQLTPATPVVPHVPEFYAPDAEHVVNPIVDLLALATRVTEAPPVASAKNAPTAVSVSCAETVNVRIVTIRLTPAVPAENVKVAVSALFAADAVAVKNLSLDPVNATE